ncbi:MAG: putative alpha/beta superfamily hydrolase [Phenylobacterium sp.]|jgi:predicted alpha/beta superfamily hydrolase
MINKFVVTLTMVLLTCTQFVSANPTSIGERISINSTVLNEARELQVLLPESYHSNSDANYPVIYLIDGDYNFHAVSGMLDLLSNKGQLIPDVILVGIADKGTDRYRQFMTPEGLTEDGKETGKASVFLRFIKEEVKPYLNIKYRITDNATLVGHSMGGLFVLNALLKSPETFEYYVSISPSVWVNNHAIIKQGKELIGKNKHQPVSLYLSLGDETQMGQYGFIHLLDDSQPDNIDWQFNHYPDESHNSVGIISLRNSLKHQYKDWYINEKALTKLSQQKPSQQKPSQQKTALADVIIAHYQQQLSQFNIKQAIPGPSIRAVIRSFYGQKNQADIPALISRIKKELPTSEQAFILTYASYVGHYDSPAAALAILQASESRFAHSLEYIKSIAGQYQKLNKRQKAFDYYQKAMKLAKQHHANQWQINIIAAKLLETADQ